MGDTVLSSSGTLVGKSGKSGGHVHSSVMGHTVIVLNDVTTTITSFSGPLATALRKCRGKSAAKYLSDLIVKLSKGATKE